VPARVADRGIWQKPSSLSRSICDSITLHTLLTFKRFGGDRNDCKGQKGRGGRRRLLQALATRTLSGVVALRSGDTVGTARARPAVSTRSERWRYECTQLRHESVGCSARLADSAGVFEQLFEEQVQLCIWRRAPDEILRAYLERSVRSGAWERRMEVSIREPSLDEKVRRLLAGFEEDLGRVRWATELLCLIDLFAALSDTQRVGVRMVATPGCTCPRLHTDAVGLRLLCTWVGEGQEWVAREDGVAMATGSMSVSNGSPVTGRAYSSATVHRMDTFAVGVFKGEGWPGNHGRGAVHRSPQPADWRVWVALDSL